MKLEGEEKRDIKKDIKDINEELNSKKLGEGHSNITTEWCPSCERWEQLILKKYKLSKELWYG